jgi:hypothetical protein
MLFGIASVCPQPPGKGLPKKTKKNKKQKNNPGKKQPTDCVFFF